MMDSTDTYYTNISSGALQTTLPKEHQIFLNALPWPFTERKICEHNIYYDIEISDTNNPSGLTFSVSIIDSSVATHHDNLISIEVNTKDLSYYFSEAKTPVFLVVVDPANASSHWVFIQDYIYKKIQEKIPEWWQQNTVTIDIPSNQEISTSLEELRQTVIYGWQFIYIKHYHLIYQRFNENIQNFYNSTEHFEHSVQQEITRYYTKNKQNQSCSCSSSSSHSCSSCQDTDSLDDLYNKWDREIEVSLQEAQSLKILDSKENRKAYYCISKALSLYGERASSGTRLTALGEMAFYDYILHLTNAYDAMGDDIVRLLTHTEEHKRYFRATEELSEIIAEALNLGEIIAVSVLAIRLADIFLFATPYIMRCFGQEPATPLMEFAQNILVSAHDMASLIESPNRLLQ